MALWQGKSNRKPTGGRLDASHGKRKFEIGREKQFTRLGAQTLKQYLLEDDYGMIDGIINNGPKQPTVADLEAQVKAGFSISLTELAAASHREQKKPSVLEKLREKTPEQTKSKTAPKRSAEREL